MLVAPAYVKVPPMHCFWCGAEFVRLDGELQCPASGMGLSKHLEGELQRIFDPATPRPATGRTKLRTSGWHCPGCGGAIERTCERCGVTLDDALIWQFVELHPHLRGP